ncbi:hypothetical protein [Lactovum miscens]|uniref:Parvulin-like peptidyl-prolyl isomerase n=1 Tax=Lactovum miscens TaxID=190387 RepID=A0A841C584_9LACT|nr:hypothetical protein [Lactovum miscens]MBB5887595.1 hypothetical protein [Lactovum miscens]
MYNNEKIQKYKTFALVSGAILILLLGLGFGYSMGHLGQKAVTKKASTKLVTSPSTQALNEATVNQFLIAYYTKKDIGENSNRYKPLMTDTMFTQATKSENQPVNQAYKGYIVNQVFNSSVNYIDAKDLTAICVVNYKNTQLVNKGDLSTGYDQTSSQTIRLTFQKEGNKYLVNNLENVTLTLPNSTSQNSYPSSSSN